MTTTPEEKPAMASELIEEVAQALFLTNDPVARWCEWEGEYVQKGEVISIADVYRRAAKAAIDLICERMQERVRAETDWQDIATAPKDGTLIDVWRGGEFPRRVPDVSWREPTDSEWWVHGGDTIRTPAATWHDMFGPFGKDDTPTHWRPLPSPPAIRETPHAEG